jgi:outer membrane protein assembly factor BamA
MKQRHIIALLLLLGSLAFAGVTFAKSNIEVTGMGYFKSRNMNSRLSFLRDAVPGEEELDVAALEDTAFLIMEQLKREGYLHPAVTGVFTNAAGVKTTAHWTDPYTVQLAADFTATHAVFTMIPGVCYFYKSIEVHGVDAIPAERVDRYFMARGALYHSESSRVFTDANFDRRIGRVLAALEDLGYRSAKLVNFNTVKDDKTGAVQASVTIDQGKRHYVGDAEVEFLDSDGKVESHRSLDQSGQLYTQDWEEDQRHLLRNEAFGLGYPDAVVTVKVQPGVENAEGALVHAVQFQVVQGTHVILSGVQFDGDEKMQRSVLNDRIDLKTGEPLNLLEVREARRRLMGLGVFSEVNVDYDPAEGPEREVVYTLKPSLRKELRLLGGWGSYEQARVGVNWEQRNPFGRAHRYTVSAKKSMKTMQAEATYSVPQILGTDLTGYVNAEHRYSEEISYDYTTQGVTMGASTFVADPGILVTAEYGFVSEDANRDSSSEFKSKDSATVASVLFRASFDRRNSFLDPSSGYYLFGSYKVANELLGGNVNFQKVEGGATYHLPLTNSTILHLGVRGGAIFTTQNSSENIPFVERFFMGGENSVRGYREGEASPLDESGKEIGAQAYVLTNVELEQRVFPNFSVVIFHDGVTNYVDSLADGASDYLYSIGGGISYQTVVGPVRLEYGYNPKPRKHDPHGALHLSVGFPF